jgi:hypothetical protein
MGETQLRHTGRRRWLVTSALLLLTFVCVALALFELPPTYQSQSSVVLLASRAASRPYGDNPYLSFSPSLTLTADVVSREMMSPGTAGQLAAQGFPDSYSVELATYTTATTGSVLQIMVDGTDKAAVELTLHGVTDEVKTILAKLQSSSPSADRIQALTLSMSSQPALSLSQMARLLAVLIGVGLVASFGLPWLVEAQIVGRRLQRSDGAAAMVPQPAEPAADAYRHSPHHASRGDFRT